MTEILISKMGLDVFVWRCMVERVLRCFGDFGVMLTKDVDKLIVDKWQGGKS
jgi:hypothetical protein